MTRARILIVEDEGIVALDLQSSLERLGYDVPVTAPSGEEALEAAASTRPDLVLMDITLEGDMDGVEAAAQIHERFKIPVVYLTAYADDDTLRRAKITEPFGYLLKPFAEGELHTTIEIALYKHRADEEREKLIEELDAFAHTAAHDLKTPLANIVSYAIMLERHWARIPDEEKRDLVRTIEQIGHKARSSIDEILLLAEVRQLEEVDIRPLDMASIVAEAQQQLAPMIQEHQAGIVLPETWPVALGYRPWVETVWVNYLSNALKYGGRPPRVELGATPQLDGKVCFWVHDNGPGLTLQEQMRLFTPFARLGQDGTQGHGLGLSIVQRIVERLGGLVWVESDRRPGQGSAFAFTLPAASTDRDCRG